VIILSLRPGFARDAIRESVPAAAFLDPAVPKILALFTAWNPNGSSALRNAASIDVLHLECRGLEMGQHSRERNVPRAPEQQDESVENAKAEQSVDHCPCLQALLVHLVRDPQFQQRGIVIVWPIASLLRGDLQAANWSWAKDGVGDQGYRKKE
jgi:hypothetical protein